ncbi:hypothetical protein L1987_80043 [Smallanthus sonchifolius]|uniref:Uncharacterized protein n=1 Tax=Smallanthus sonchifolius TaxID=185202 RepID=A0ACB8YLS1_9ASTR|nr:hypothetical protein L1987_80043 [Smallanthus sonchifolius]
MGEEVVKKVEEEVKPHAGDEEKGEEPKDPPPPPPPQEVVLRVFMHCEGCARKVRRSLKGFEGVEDVITDCKTHKVVVKGEKADPLKVLERVQKKSNRKVELLSPVPNLPAEKPKKSEQEEPPKSEEKPGEKKDELPAPITVVLKVHMHCEACAQDIRKRILRMKGVENALPDLKNSQVAVKGIFPAVELVDYVYKRTGKHAVIVNQDPGKTEEDKKEEKKADEGGDKKEEKKAENGGEKQEEAAQPDDTAATPSEMKKSEYYYYLPPNYHLYPSREAAYAYPPAPQMFSDENPNACSIM